MLELLEKKFRHSFFVKNFILDVWQGSEYASKHHCVKSVRICSFSGPYSVQMREITDQKNSEYRHSSRSAHSNLH